MDGHGAAATAAGGGPTEQPPPASEAEAAGVSPPAAAGEVPSGAGGGVGGGGATHSGPTAAMHLDDLDGDVVGDGWTPTIDMYGEEPTERYESPPSASHENALEQAMDVEKAENVDRGHEGEEEDQDGDDDDDDDAFGMPLRDDDGGDDPHLNPSFGSAPGLLTQCNSRDEESDAGGSGGSDTDDGRSMDGRDDEDDNGEDDVVSEGGEMVVDDDDGGGEVAVEEDSVGGTAASDDVGAGGPREAEEKEEHSAGTDKGGGGTKEGSVDSVAATNDGTGGDSDGDDIARLGRRGNAAKGGNLGGAPGGGPSEENQHGLLEEDTDEANAASSSSAVHSPPGGAYAGLTEETETQLVNVLSPARSGGPTPPKDGGETTPLGSCDSGSATVIATMSPDAAGNVKDSEVARKDDKVHSPMTRKGIWDAPDGALGMGLADEQQGFGLTEESEESACGDKALSPQSQQSGPSPEKAGNDSAVRSLWMDPPPPSNRAGEGLESMNLNGGFTEESAVGKEEEPIASSIGKSESGGRGGRDRPPGDKDYADGTGADVQASQNASHVEHECSVHDEPSEEKVAGSMSFGGVGGTLGSCNDWTIYSGETEPLLPPQLYSGAKALRDDKEGDESQENIESTRDDGKHVDDKASTGNDNIKTLPPKEHIPAQDEEANTNGNGADSSGGTDAEVPETGVVAANKVDSIVSERKGTFDLAHYHDAETEQFPDGRRDPTPKESGHGEQEGRNEGTSRGTVPPTPTKKDATSNDPIARSPEAMAPTTEMSEDGANQLQSPKVTIDGEKLSLQEANASIAIADKGSCRNGPDQELQSVRDVAVEDARLSSERDSGSENVSPGLVESKHVENPAATGPLISHTQTLASYPQDHIESSRVDEPSSCNGDTKRPALEEGSGNGCERVERQISVTKEKDKENAILSANSSPSESGMPEGVGRGGGTPTANTTLLSEEKQKGEVVLGEPQVLSTTTVLTATPHSQVLLDPYQPKCSGRGSLLKKVEASVAVVNKVHFNAAPDDDIEETDDEEDAMMQKADVVPPTPAKESKDIGITLASNASDSCSQIIRSHDGDGAIDSTPHITNKASSVLEKIQRDEGNVEKKAASKPSEASKHTNALSKEAPRDSVSEKNDDIIEESKLSRPTVDEPAKPSGGKDSKQSGTRRGASSKAPAPWLHSRRGHKKGQRDGDKMNEKDVGCDDSDTPQLRLPECPLPKQHELKESEASGSSTDEEISWGNPSSNNDDHTLQDTQDDDYAVASRHGAKLKESRQSTEDSDGKERPFKRIQKRKESFAQAPPACTPLNHSNNRKVDERRRFASDATPKRTGGGKKKRVLERFQDDAEDVSDQGDDEISSSDSDAEDGIQAEEPTSQPSQNTREIDSLMGRLNNAMASLKNPAKEIEKLKRRVVHLKKRNDSLEQEREKVLAENALLRKQLAVKSSQNVKMKEALANFVPLIDQLPANDAADDSEIDGAHDTASVTKSSVTKRRASSERPVVVPPSSTRPKAKVARTKAARSKERSSQKKKKKKKRQHDDETVLSALSPKGKKLDFESKKRSNSAEKPKAIRQPQPAPARSTFSKGGNTARGDANLQVRSSRRGASKRDLIPEDMQSVPFGDVWNFLNEKHGWRYELGPEPYNNVYVCPSANHTSLEANRVNIDFFDDDTLLYAKAKELGFSPHQESSDESEEEPEEAPAKDPRADEPVEAPEEDDKSHESTAHISLSASLSASSGVSDEDGDSSIDDDNTNLCGDGKILTRQSIRKCARLIRTFSKQSDTASFNNLLWTPLWEQIKEGQGGSDGIDLKWQYAKSRGKLAQRAYWFVPPFSKGAEGKPGIDYFESEEAVVLRVLQISRGFDSNAFVKDESAIKEFEAILVRAVENGVAFNEARSNPGLGAGRRQRRRKVLDFASSPQSKKNKTTETRRGKGATSKATVSFQSAPAPVAFSQNTLEGADILLQLNKPKPGSRGSDPPADCPTTPSYDDVVTKRGITQLKRSRQLALRKVSPKKRTTPTQPVPAKKKQKVATPVPKGSPASVERLSQVPYHLSQSPEDLSQSNDLVNFTRGKKPRQKSAKGMLPFDGLSFFVSGLALTYHHLIEELGGNIASDVSSLKECDVHGKLFFISHASQRRKIKYLYATACGVPMLHYSWLIDLKRRYAELKESDELDRVKQLPYDSALFKAKRLPVGLSIQSGLFHLQKARHAKRWYRPGQEIGEEHVIFYGMKVVVALNNESVEKEWGKILSAAGASVVYSSAFKSDKKSIIDAVLVDRVTLPPHTTAAPSNVTKLVNFVNSGRAKNSDGTTNIPVLDLSWALQCIVERQRLCFDADERYRISSSDLTRKGSKVFEIKVKTGNDLVRYEVGDIVEFGKPKGTPGKTKGTARIGRIASIHDSSGRRKSRMLEVQLLERNGNFELMDGGKDSTHVTIDENELHRHIVMLSTRDFKDVKDGGYVPKSEEESYIFMQRKAPTSKR